MSRTYISLGATRSALRTRRHSVSLELCPTGRARTLHHNAYVALGSHESG